MKKNFFAKVVMICLFAVVFFPKDSFAQTPRNGDIYYYKYCVQKNGKEKCIYMAVKFLENAIKVCDTREEMSLEEFKQYVQKNINTKEIIEYNPKDSKDGKVQYETCEDYGCCEWFDFSQLYNKLTKTFMCDCWDETKYVRIQSEFSL